MSQLPILSLTTFAPLLGALLLLLFSASPTQARRIALLFSTLTFALSLYALSLFDPTAGAAQLTERIPLIPALGIDYFVGVDGISMALILLTTLLTPLAILVSKHVEHRVREYMVAFLVLETLMIGTFTALDTILFYVFFESVLIPMFLIIGIWGGARRVYAAFKFFLYTLLGSILMLVALLVLYHHTGTTSMPETITALKATPLPETMQAWLWFAFLASFAVKLPMWPVHTWLPDAHVEAPTAGSIILAGVLLKMGGYGFIRFSLPMLPDASALFAPLMWWLAVAAIIYTSLVALAQTDMKKLIAYSSVAHMGFVTLGLFALNNEGLQGAMFQMISHGIVSGALFLCVGVLYDRMHTRDIAAYGGVVNVMPRFAVLFMVMTMASVGLPGTSGFVGEFLSLLGGFKANQTVAVFATLGVVLGAAYMLWLYRRVMYGVIANPQVAALKDLEKHEVFALVLLAILVIWLGVQPDALLHFVQPAIEQTMAAFPAQS